MSSAAAQQDGSPALAVDGLVAGYGGVIALDGVSISAGTAAITAVLGANGAGKTTLLRAVSGMIKPRRGRVLLAGADLAGRSPEQIVRAGIAHVPEGQGVIPELTVEENLRVGMMSWPPRGIRGAGSPPVPGGSPGGSSPRELAEPNGPPRSTRPTSVSGRWPTVGASWPPRCPAASGRCWSSRGRCWRGHAYCCSTSLRSAWRPGSWPRSWTWWSG